FCPAASSWCFVGFDFFGVVILIVCLWLVAEWCFVVVDGFCLALICCISGSVRACAIVGCCSCSGFCTSCSSSGSSCCSTCRSGCCTTSGCRPSSGDNGDVSRNGFGSGDGVTWNDDLFNVWFYGADVLEYEF